MGVRPRGLDADQERRSRATSEVSTVGYEWFYRCDPAPLAPTDLSCSFRGCWWERYSAFSPCGGPADVVTSVCWKNGASLWVTCATHVANASRTGGRKYGSRSGDLNFDTNYPPDTVYAIYVDGRWQVLDASRRYAKHEADGSLSNCVPCDFVPEATLEQALRDKLAQQKAAIAQIPPCPHREDSYSCQEMLHEIAAGGTYAVTNNVFDELARNRSRHRRRIVRRTYRNFRRFLRCSRQWCPSIVRFRGYGR